MELFRILESDKTVENFVNNAYKLNNSAMGAKHQLLIIADMLEESEDKKWHADQIRKYCDWIQYME